MCIYIWSNQINSSVVSTTYQMVTDKSSSLLENKTHPLHFEYRYKLMSFSLTTDYQYLSQALFFPAK